MLTSGWHEDYFVYVYDQTDTEGAPSGYGFKAYQIGTVSYVHGQRVWRGYMDTIPGESSYDYRWWFEIKTNCDKTDDPGENPCRHWITDFSNNVLTPYFGFTPTDVSTIHSSDPTCEVYAGNVETPSCTRDGIFLSYLNVLPKLLTRIPGKMSLTASGLINDNLVDHSGILISSSKYFISYSAAAQAFRASCPPNFPNIDGEYFDITPCSFSYVAQWLYLFQGTSFCYFSNPGTYSWAAITSGFIILVFSPPFYSGGVVDPLNRVTVFQVTYFAEGRMDAWGGPTIYRRNPEQGPTFSWGGHTYNYAFPDTLTVQFEDWEL